MSFHIDVTHYRPLLGMGLPTFLLLSIAFGVVHDRQRGMAEMAIRRGKRLLLPWIAWSLFYLGWAFIVSGHRAHGVWTELPSGWGILLGGTEVHLWFLPFAFGATLGACFLDRMMWRIRSWLLAVVCLLAAGLLVAAEGFMNQRFPALGLLYPFGQWLFAFPAIPLGLLLGRCIQRGTMATWPQRWVAIGVGSMAVAIPAGILYGPLSPIRYVLACGIVMVGLAWRGKPIRSASFIASLLLGVYAVHMLIIDIWRFSKLKANPYVTTLVIMSVSLLISYGLKQMRFRRTS